MTPRELRLFAEVYNKRMEAEQERRHQEIYISASLISNFVWAKKKPTYEQVFKKKKKAMTDEEMYQAVKALNFAFGGEDLSQS